MLQHTIREYIKCKDVQLFLPLTRTLALSALSCKSATPPCVPLSIGTPYPLPRERVRNLGWVLKSRGRGRIGTEGHTRRAYVKCSFSFVLIRFHAWCYLMTLSLRFPARFARRGGGSTARSSCVFSTTSKSIWGGSSATWRRWWRSERSRAAAYVVEHGCEWLAVMWARSRTSGHVIWKEDRGDFKEMNWSIYYICRNDFFHFLLIFWTIYFNVLLFCV